ncbi:MAG: tRNA adenosine(34) deaminase TadA [Anaerolineae bacterium]|nr:tRNA adenosine(34) deaminase TadA [Anaerolineae bacterium]
MDDAAWMRLALAEAEKAVAHGDVPIGAIAVHQGQIIGSGYNCRERDDDPTAHAEMLAIREAAHILGRWRLDDVTIYCTLEPCAMCAGAMVLARIPRLVYAAPDLKAGAGGSIIDILRHDRLNHRVDVQGGLLADEASAQIRAFFAGLRRDGQK